MNCWSKRKVTVDQLAPRRLSLALDSRKRRPGKVVMLETPEKLEAWQREKGLKK